MDLVSEAFAAVPRIAFLPAEQRRHADEDRPLPIGHGATNSQPWTVAHMLRLLDVSPGDRVLDVGSGSGWTTALLAHLTGPTGDVIGVETVPALVEMGRANLGRRFSWARIVRALPGVLGWRTKLPTTASWCRPTVDACPPSSRHSSPSGGGWCCPRRPS